MSKDHHNNNPKTELKSESTKDNKQPDKTSDINLNKNLQESKFEKIASKFIKNIALFFQSSSSFVATTLVGLLVSFGSFPPVYSFFQNLTQNLGFDFNLSQVAFSIVGVLSLFLAFSCFIQFQADFWSLSKSIRVWIHSTFISIFILLYASGVDRLILFSFNLNQNQIIIDTGIIFLPLVLLQFLVIENLFYKNQEDRKENYFWLLLSQIVLVTLQSLSLISFLAVDRTENRLFSWWLLDLIFSLPNQVWLFFASLLITFLTFEYLQLLKFIETQENKLSEKIQKNSEFKIRTWWQFFFIFWLLTFQTLFITSIIPISYLSYWHRMLLFLVLWDFYYQFVPQGLNLLSGKNFRKKLPVAIAYHLFLILLIVFLPAL